MALSHGWLWCKRFINILPYSVIATAQEKKKGTKRSAEGKEADKSPAALGGRAEAAAGRCGTGTRMGSSAPLGTRRKRLDARRRRPHAAGGGEAPTQHTALILKEQGSGKLAECCFLFITRLVVSME